MTSTETPAKVGTSYIVLQRISLRKPTSPGLRDGDDDQVDVTEFDVPHAWREVTRVTAASAEAAIRTIADQTEGGGDVITVAIPATSWHPRKVTVTSKPVVTLEDA